MRQVGNVDAARRRLADVGETDCRVVLARIRARTVLAALRNKTQKAIRRHVLCKNSPGLALRFELIGQIRAAKIIEAVVGHALRRPAKERQVIRFGGVCDARVSGRQAIPRYQLIEVRCILIIDNAAGLFVLHDQNVNVIESQSGRLAQLERNER